MITFITIVVLVAVLYIFTNWFSLVTGYLKGEDQTTRLATCLNKKGVEFYGSLYCADCEKQRNEFGTAFEKIKQIDCGKEKEKCPNIREIPAWYLNREFIYGYKTIDELKKLSGC